MSLSLENRKIVATTSMTTKKNVVENFLIPNVYVGIFQNSKFHEFTMNISKTISFAHHMHYLHRIILNIKFRDDPTSLRCLFMALKYLSSRA